MIRAPSTAWLKLSTSELKIGLISFGRQSQEYLNVYRGLSQRQLCQRCTYFSHITSTCNCNWIGQRGNLMACFLLPGNFHAFHMPPNGLWVYVHIHKYIWYMIVVTLDISLASFLLLFYYASDLYVIVSAFEITRRLGQSHESASLKRVVDCWL